MSTKVRKRLTDNEALALGLIIKPRIDDGNPKYNITHEQIVAIPYSFKNFTIEQYAVSGTYLIETDSKDLNHWKTKIPNSNYKYIGRSNELSPELWKRH